MKEIVKLSPIVHEMLVSMYGEKLVSITSIVSGTLWGFVMDLMGARATNIRYTIHVSPKGMKLSERVFGRLMAHEFQHVQSEEDWGSFGFYLIYLIGMICTPQWFLGKRTNHPMEKPAYRRDREAWGE